MKILLALMAMAFSLTGCTTYNTTPTPAVTTYSTPVVPAETTTSVHTTSTSYN